MPSLDTLPPVPPPPAAGLDPLAVARNGVPPSGLAARSLAGFLHHNAGYRLKVLGQFSQLPADCLSTDTDTIIYRTLCHTSPNCDKVILDLTLAPANGGEADVGFDYTPQVYLVSKTADTSAQPATLAGTATEVNVIYTTSKSTAVVPNDYVYERQQFALTADTTYALELHTVDYARVVSATIFEVPRSKLPIATCQSVDLSRLRKGGPIVDADVNDFAATLHKLQKRGGRTLIRWSKLDGSYVSRASATPSNILDSDAAAWGAQTPGFYCHSADCGTLVGGSDNVLAWAYMSAAGEGAVSFVRNGATVAGINVDGVAAGYYSATGALPSSADWKVDILAGGDGSDSALVYAAGLFEYE